MGIQTVVGSVRLGLGGDIDAVSVGGTGRGGGRYGQDIDGDIQLIMRKDMVANVIFGTETNASLAYDL